MLTRKPRSFVWKHFHLDDIQPQMATCDKCGIAVKYNKGGPTTNLISHLQRHHAEFVPVMATSNSVQDRVIQGLTDLTIDQCLPIGFCEAPLLRKIVHELNPDIKLPCRETMSSLITQKCMLVQRHIEGLIENQTISITLDHWTSISQDNFMAVTAHFIDETYILEDITLGCFPSCSHKSDLVERELVDILGKYNLGLNQVLQVVSDTASIMNKFGENVSFIFHNNPR